MKQVLIKTVTAINSTMNLCWIIGLIIVWVHLQSRCCQFVYSCIWIRWRYRVSQKIPPPTVFWNFFPDVWEFLINCLHTYYAIFSTLDYKFLFQYLQLWRSYAILTTKRDHLANFYILSLLTEQMTSLLTSCHIQLVCWHYKSVYFIVTCHRQRSTKLNDLRKRLNACFSANDGDFEHIMWTG